MQFQKITAGRNHIRGAIPVGFGNLSNLFLMDLRSNELSGDIPVAVTRLKMLQVMSMSDNRISGSIPFEIGQMENLNILSFEVNQLSGKMPSSINNISRLQYLLLSANILSASLPQSLWSLTSLIRLNLSGNNLVGSVPMEVSKLKILDTLDVSKNRLSGNISSAVGDLQMLAYLDLSSNSFRGLIPQSFGRMINIAYLNMSHNFLSGAIPKSLATLRYLNSLDLSFNMLEGDIPQGRVFSNSSIPSLVGNAALCGAPQLGLAPCSETSPGSGSRRKLYFLKFILPTIVSTAILLISFCLVLKFRRRPTKNPDHNEIPSLDNFKLISYHELVRATENFSEANLLGKGSFGTVFKACLDDGLLTAVKVLNLEADGASRSFDTECQALSMVRHRNLVKTISTCANLDFKALILEFMTNGSLEKWLYSDEYSLNLLQRINIMIDVSLALEYLHHHYTHVIVHRDLKPSNVLLDENMIGHVGDFGIAKLVLGDSKSIVTTSTPGTIGYMAPEYGFTGKVSRKGDVYSFGILLLETFTRRRPTDAMFNGELSLRQWVSRAHPATIAEVVDCSLFADDSINEPGTTHQCLSSVIELGLLCSMDSLKERILMKDVVPRLLKIKVEYVSQLGCT